ncbi:hypothetical protein FSP39_008962 [Pinctada imbricata]|uniref:Bromodomain adjacent to zinc finger domain protein 1A n=1 Tax=Pinctada imbricata TaxID=66713 RepID=A0AA88YAX3_PINIB|nr:hypothetical protein FSP39_008962 [Pinctada imbricata]
MPLLRRQPFQRQKPPPDLDPDEEVFHCPLTNEIFRDYEDFFERIILCNSLVWSCSITGRSGLTYQEAVECEEKALKNLASFPIYLQKPMLFLATLTHRSRLNDLNDDIFLFAKDRYFIGEVVDITLGNERKSCKVLRVIPPAIVPENTGCIVIDSDEEEQSKEKPKGANFKADTYKYVVQERGKATNITITVPAKQVCRKKGLYTRDKSKLFLKQYCETDNGIWKVKGSIIKKKGLEEACFADFFAGPPPVFGVSESKRKSSGKKHEEEEDDYGRMLSPSKRKDDKKKKKIKEGPLEKAPFERDDVIKLTAEERALISEQYRQQKMAERAAQKEELKKKKVEDMLRRKEERAKEREQKMEERRKQHELYKEWSKMRDDMECDDLKVMPEPTPIKTKIPAESFGDAVMVLEFMNCFRNLIDLKEYFPKGFTFEILEQALLDTDHNGLLTDILLMIMSTIFTMQEEEEAEEEALSKEDKANQMTGTEEIDADMDLEELMDTATQFAQIPQLTHGTLLRKLPLDSFTLTEIVRLHILASGAKVSDKNVKYRYQQRGGYTSQDDPGLLFKCKEPTVIRSLATENIFDIPPSDKLKILNVLIQQILTYASTRDNVEEMCEKFRISKHDLKHFQWSEQRREREEQAARYRRRQEERQREKEKEHKKRMKQLKELEKKLTDQRMGENGTVDGERKDDEEEEDDDGEISMTEEEKEELRQQEEEDEANRKAEFAMKEKKMILDLAKLQHSCSIAPLGRDRLYRRYWVFQSLPGLFIEDDENLVKEEAKIPINQNPLSNPLTPEMAARMKSMPVSKPAQSDSASAVNGGSDKENESFNNSTANTSMNVSTANNTLNTSTAENSINPSVNTSLNTSQLSSANTSLVNGIPNGSQNVKIEEKGKITNGNIISVSDDEDNLSKSRKESPKVSSLEKVNLAVRQIIDRPRCVWSFLSTPEEYDELISSLNPRGFRESALKSTLLEQKNRIVEIIDKTPNDVLCPKIENEIIEEERARSESPAEVGIKTRHKNSLKRASKGLVKNECAQEILEIHLRETLLDFEERIFIGGLGVLKVHNRQAWRESIESGSYDPQTDDPLFAKYERTKVKEESEVGDDQSMSSEDTTECVVKDLGKSLLQLARSLEAKYLLVPLGENEKPKGGRKSAAELRKEKKKREEEERKKQEEEERKRREAEENDSDEEQLPMAEKIPEKTTKERWEDSVLSCTSLPQLFLHIETLDKSIFWDKSALHARCKICRRKGDADQMLLCDLCDRGHHMYCLKPKIKSVPKGDWYCPDCRPKEKKHSPLKNRRKTFTEEEEEEPMEEEQEEEEDTSREMEEDGDDLGSAADSEGEDTEITLDLDTICAVCGNGGILVCCDACPLMYHIECVDPPLKKVPKGRWECNVCTDNVKQSKVKLPKGVKGGKKKGGASKQTPTSSRTSSRRGSPRDSPITVKGGKKREKDFSDDDTPKLKKGGRSTSKLAEVNGDEPKHYVSSSRGNSKVQSMKQLQGVVQELMKLEDSEPFLKPVSKKLVPDYYDIIAIPMDFGTIKNKINNFDYNDVSDLITDVRQIFSNCAEYNRKSTPEFKAGAALSKIFEKRLKDLHIEAETPPPNKKQRRQ